MNEHASPGCCDAGMMDLVSAGAMFPSALTAATGVRRRGPTPAQEALCAMIDCNGSKDP